MHTIKDYNNLNALTSAIDRLKVVIAAYEEQLDILNDELELLQNPNPPVQLELF